MNSGLNNNKVGRNLKYEKENRELRYEKVFELSTLGYSQADIATKLGVSVGLVNSDLKHVYKKARDTFHTYQQEELPKEFRKAIVTYEHVIIEARKTAETTQDERTKISALKEMREARTAMMDLISNHDVMAYQVSKQNKQSMISPNSENTEEDTDVPTSPHCDIGEEEDQEVKQEDA